MKLPILCICLTLCATASAQDLPQTPQDRIDQLEKQVKTLRYTELVQSMSQRSLLTPAYFGELKALVARQAYNFWKENDGNPLVSHLNVYSALYYANKFLGYDSVNVKAYNEALGHDESVISIQFGKDPRYFYSAGSDGRVLKWELANFNKAAEVIYEGNHLIKSIDVSSNDEWILVVTKTEGIIIINTQKSKELGDAYQAVRDPELVQSGVFVPGESKVIVVTKTGEIKTKGFSGDVSIGRKTDSKVASMAVNPKNKDLYLGSAAGNVEVWEDTLAAKIYLPESFSVNAMAISPNFKTLALGREKGDVILWDLESETLIRTISGHQSAITDVDFSPDNKLLLTSSRDRTVRIWDIENSKKLPLVFDDHSDWVMTACFDPTGKKVISGSRDNYIRFWPVEHQVLADRICSLISRDLTEEEWNEYVGSDIGYETSCSAN